MSLCQLRQFRISSALDDGRPLALSLRRHIDSCPHCREFAEKSGSLVAKLTPGETARPPWLHTKIMAKLRTAAPPARAASSRRWLQAAAGLAAIALAAGLIYLSTNGTPNQQTVTPKGDEWGWESPPVDFANVPASLEKRAKQALSKEFRDLATDISGARNFLTASLRSTIPGLADD